MSCLPCSISTDGVVSAVGGSGIGGGGGGRISVFYRSLVGDLNTTAIGEMAATRGV